MKKQNIMWVMVVVCLLFIGCGEPKNNGAPERSLSNGTAIGIAIAGSSTNAPVSVSPGAFDQAVYDSLGAAEFSYGGLIYDKWYVAAGVDNIPTANHPLWTGTSPDVVNEETWRCKACHGWDYRGVDGIYGTNPDSKRFSGLCGMLDTPNCPNSFTTAQEVWIFLHDGGTTPGIANPADHAFADWLPDDELYALTKFVITAREEAAAGDSPADKIMSDPTLPSFKRVIGNAGRGMKLYSLPSEEGGCDEGCHGADGMLIDFKPPDGKFVDTYANDNPWEVLHKIRFGHPGADPYMPGIAEYGLPMFDQQGGVDVLAYVQAGLVRSPMRGARLYDNWIVESGADTSQEMPNPLLKIAPNPPADQSIDYWRCSQCHGFDYEGGAFGFDNNLVDLKVVNNWTAGYVFSVLKNGYKAIDPATITGMIVHQYGDFMTDQQLWDLADFAASEIFDTHMFIRAPTGGVREPQGVVADGELIYNGGLSGSFPDGSPLDCITCHGADGKLAVRADGSATDLFMMAWDMPWKFMHRARYGSPRLPGATVVGPGLFIGTLDNEHAITGHDVANVQVYAQENLLSSAPATVAAIQSKRIENTLP